MRNITAAIRGVILAAGLSATSQAAIFYDSGVTSLSSSDPIQLGRLSRNGIISDWTTVKSFPGAVNTSTPYSYTTYNIPILNFPFLQITFDDIAGSADTFVSAYLNSYDPANKALNYLGDEGSSGNYFGVIPTVFQVAVNPGNTLVILVNDSSPAGVGEDYRLLVEGFSDTNFSETPEPSQWGLNALGLAGAGLLYWRRKALTTRKESR